MITGESLARAETSLIRARDLVPEDRVLFDRAFCEQTGVESFLRHHMSILTAHSPSIDPTLEPTIVTMLRHMLLVGAVAGRQDVNPE